MRDARDGNEAPNKNGPQGSTHIDDCGHADCCVGKRTNGQERPSRGDICNADGLLFGALVLGRWTRAVHQLAHQSLA